MIDHGVQALLKHWDVHLLGSLLLFPLLSCSLGVSAHDSIALVVMQVPGISLTLFVSWLCLDSHSE